MRCEASKFRVEVVFEVEGKDAVGKEGADEDSDKWKTSDTTFEVVDVRKDEWECFKPEVENCIRDWEKEQCQSDAKKGKGLELR